ncbi:MAG TPA: TolC family protein [Longimicrobiales bacterium]|nr:TolC family protein [Longimicrobiales bacterium]
MRRALAAASLAVMCALPAAAQQPQHLTLDEALRIARENNPEFRRTANDLELEENRIRSAWGAFLPQVSSSMSVGGNRSTAITGINDFGEPVNLPEARTSRGSSISQSIGANVTLFDGGASLRNLWARRAGYTGVEAQIDATTVTLEANVARGYYRALQTTRLIALEERLLASARERLSRTEEMLRIVPTTTQVDVLGARADVASSEQSLERARGEADKARLALAVQLGMQPNTSITVDSVLPAIFDPRELDEARLVATALARHPLIRSREAQLRAAQHGVSAARGRRLPRIGANAGYSRGMSLPNYSAFRELDPQNYSFSFGLSLSLPLFSQFQTAEAIGSAEAAAKDAGFDVAAARLAVERDVRQALIDLVNAHRSLQLAELQVDLNRQRQDLTLEQYRNGSRSFLDLQNVINQAAQAERQVIEARFAFINARTTLEERLGFRLEA